MDDAIKFFAMPPDDTLGQLIVEKLNIQLAELKARNFADGEHKIRSMEGVNEKDVYVLHSLYSDLEYSVNDKLVRLLFFLGSLKDAGAKRVTALMPYLAYARKDRKTKSRDPLNTQYLARMLESVGTDRVITLDVHNLQAYQNAFRIKNEHLEAKRLFAAYIEENLETSKLALMSPDAGGIKRASALKGLLQQQLEQEIPLIFMEKERSMGEVSGDALVGQVHDKDVVIVDDMISTGTTLSWAARACKEGGARSVRAMATHGLFVKSAGDTLSVPALEEIVICNSIPPFRLQNTEVEQKLKVLDISGFLADTIRSLHRGEELMVM